MANDQSSVVDQHMPFPYRAMRAVFGGLFRLLTRFTVAGYGNLPPSGPLVMVTNHLHRLDSVVLLVAIPYRITVLVAEKYRNSFPIGNLVKMADGIFIRRGEIDRRALRLCLQALDSGGVLGMAPEGTRSVTGALQRAKVGAVYFVQKTGAPVLPVAVWGTESIVSRWMRLRRPHIHVAIGEPFELTRTSAHARSKELQAMADEIMLHIGALLPESYHGVYSDQLNEMREAKNASAGETNHARAT